MENSSKVGWPTKSSETRARTLWVKVRKTFATVEALRVTVWVSLVQVGNDFPVTLLHARSKASPVKVAGPATRPVTWIRVFCPGLTPNSCRSTSAPIVMVRRMHCTPVGGTTVSSAEIESAGDGDPSPFCSEDPQARGKDAASS